MLVNFEKHAIKVYQYSFIDFDLHKKKLCDVSQC